MDFDREWTTFALEAEEEAHGFVRIAREHNKLRAEVEKMGHTTWCAYCGEYFVEIADANACDKIGAHIAVCPKHPMREVERERDEARAEVETQHHAFMAGVEERCELARERDEARSEVERLRPYETEALAARNLVTRDGRASLASTRRENQDAYAAARAANEGPK